MGDSNIRKEEDEMKKFAKRLMNVIENILIYGSGSHGSNVGWICAVPASIVLYINFHTIDFPVNTWREGLAIIVPLMVLLWYSVSTLLYLVMTSKWFLWIEAKILENREKIELKPPGHQLF